MSDSALGVTVTKDGLFATLIQQKGEELEVLFRVSPAGQDRGPGDEPGSSTEEIEPVDGEEEVIGLDDEIGEVEFGGDDDIGGLQEEVLSEDNSGPDEDQGPVWKFQNRLNQLIGECQERGVQDPEIAFLTRAGSMENRVLFLPDGDGGEGERENSEVPLAASRETLEEQFEEETGEEIGESQSGLERPRFLPATPEGSSKREIGIALRSDGSICRTLQAINDETFTQLPRTNLIDGELSLYFRLGQWVASRRDANQAESGRRIIVRSLEGRSLVLFVEEGRIRHFEQLSVGVGDLPETVARRSLLLKDEKMPGPVSLVMVTDNQGGERLSEAMEEQFPDAEVRVLRKELPSVTVPKISSSPEAQVGATAVALRRLERDGEASKFFRQGTNLLPSRYRPSTLRVPVRWPVFVLMGGILVLSLFFVWLYLQNLQTINQKESRLGRIEQEIELNNISSTEALQGRLDSLQQTQEGFAAANSSLDNLVEGANKWSRTLESLTQVAKQVGGVSFESISPAGDGTAKVSGQASNRGRVLQMANRLDGSVRVLATREIRDATVYQFNILVPVNESLPKFAKLASLSSNQDGTVASVSENSSALKASADENADASSSNSSSIGSSSEGDWSVIVGAFQRRGQARDMKERYAKQVNRDVRILNYESRGDGDQWNVVGVGRFDRQEEARSLIRGSEQFPEGAWVLQQ